MQTANQNEEDLVTLLFVVCGGAATGVFSLGMILNPVRDWMVQHSLLEAGQDVVLPIVGDVGFGWPQLTVIGGLLIASIVLVVWLRRRSRDRA